jgi:hypothetical protein
MISIIAARDWLRKNHAEGSVRGSSRLHSTGVSGSHFDVGWRDLVEGGRSQKGDALKKGTHLFF